MSSPPRDVVEFVELGVVPVAIIIVVNSNRIVINISRLVHIYTYHLVALR